MSGPVCADVVGEPVQHASVGSAGMEDALYLGVARNASTSDRVAHQPADAQRYSHRTQRIAPGCSEPD